MDFIKNLKVGQFSIFDVNLKKEPVDYFGSPLDGWNILPREDLYNEHDMNKTLWGMKMGQHENGRFILSLDFDICGKANKITKIRMGCEFTKQKYEEYRAGVGEKLDGLYSSSTQGNFNVLVDYTNSNQLRELVKTIGKAKFTYHEMEILLGGYQVIPPSATTCKITHEKGNPRTFQSDKPFYVIESTEDSFLFNFIKSLMLEKIASTTTKSFKSSTKSSKTINAPSEQTTENIDELIESDEYIKLLFEVIDNRTDENGAKIISHDQWFQICGILKFNGYNKNVWLKYSQKISVTNTASNLWDKIKNQRPMSIYGLQNIAKAVNLSGYREWFFKYKTVDFSERGIAELYYKLEGKNLHYQGGIMYIYHQNEWRLDERGEIWNYKISHTLTDFLIDDLEFYNQLVINLLKKESLNEDDNNKKDKADFMAKTLKGIILQLKKNKFVKEIIKQLQNIISASVKKPVYFDVGPEQYYNINFRNGIYDLKTKEFRARNYTDYVTKFLEFDYKPKSEISKLSIDTVNEFFHKLQPNKEQREFTLGFLAYCITGDTSKQIF